MHDVRDITISKDSRFALVSYEHKAPPQLWRIGMVKGDARLALLHTYMPKYETDFAGPSYFGGRDDQLVFCASKGRSRSVQRCSPLADEFPAQPATSTSGTASRARCCTTLGRRRATGRA